MFLGGTEVFKIGQTICGDIFRPETSNSKSLIRDNLGAREKYISDCNYLVPGAGIEPAQPRGPRDFKSLASTNSATQAGVNLANSI